MNTTPVSKFRMLSKEDMLELRPVILTFDGEPIGVFADPNGVVVIEDMHPAVRQSFRAKENVIRSGMGNTSYKGYGSDVPVAV